MSIHYKDTTRNQLIYVGNYDPSKQAEVVSFVNETFTTYKAKKNKSEPYVVQKIDEWMQYANSYIHSKQPIVLGQTFKSNHLAFSLFTSTWIINTATEHSKKAGLNPNTEKYGAKIRYYEFDSNGQKFEQLTTSHNTSHNKKGNIVLFCVTKEEGITECEVTVYPHFEEEVSISNLSYNLLTQCSTYNKELSVPLQEGTIVVLSESTNYSLHHIKGKGKCYILEVVLYTD